MFFIRKPERKYSNEDLLPYLNEDEKIICQVLGGNNTNHYVDLTISCKPNLHDIVKELNTKEEQ